MEIKLDLSNMLNKESKLKMEDFAMMKEIFS